MFVGTAVELYNRSNDPNLNQILASTNIITTIADVYRFDFGGIGTYNKAFVNEDSITNIASNTYALTEISEVNTRVGLKIENAGLRMDGDLRVGGVINQTGASWSLGGFNNGVYVNLPYLVNSNIPFSVKQTPEVNCIYNTVNHNITIQKGGKYLVHYGAMSENNTTTIEIFLRKNGVNVYSAYSSASSNTYRMAQASILLDLDIGDIVSIYLGKGAMHSTQIFRYFNGYLIG
jgi:hypothetical protein